MYKAKAYFYILLLVLLCFSIIFLATTYSKNFEIIFTLSKLNYSNDKSLEEEYLDKVSNIYNINREVLSITNAEFLINAIDKTSPIYLTKSNDYSVDVESNNSLIEESSILPKDTTVLIKGMDGGLVYNYTKYILKDSTNTWEKKHIDSIEYVTPIDDRLIIGNNIDFNSSIKNRLLNNIEQVESKEILNEREYSSEIFDNLTINDFNLNTNTKEVSFKENSVVLGNIKVNMGNCRRDTSISVVFNILTNSVEFNNFSGFIDTLCKKQFIQENNYLVGTCIDCTLYPVGKGYALNPAYAPEIVLADFEGSYKQISKSIYTNLSDMYNSARNDGIYMSFTSTYRSYLDQYYTYEYWVSIEMSKGYSRSEAEVIANTYSAIPGFSEHQLGTTLDINGIGCSISEYCSNNLSVWDWLSENAYKYGFIQSYKEGQNSGYIAEPWHLRWIGVDLALEYKKVEKEQTLQTFLYNLGRY